MRQFAAVLVAMFTTIGHAQVVHRYATFTNEGAKMEVKDSVRVSASDFHEGLYQVTVHGWVHDDYINEVDKSVMAGAALLTVKKDTIGEIFDPYPTDSLWESNARRMSKYHEVVLSGKVKGRQLERRSFPSITVQRFFENSRGGAVRDALVDVLKVNGWEGKDFDEYECWAYLNRSANPTEPDFQALMIFRNGMPYCLVNKGEDFEYAKLKGKEERDHGMFYFFQRPNDRFLTQVEEIVFDYVQL